MIEVYVDGLSQPPNEGVGTYGFIVYKEGKKLQEGHGMAGVGVTNNYAEYVALIQALDSIRAFVGEPVTVKSDSKLLVNQMKGEWKVKKGVYLPKYRDAKEAARAFKAIRFVWVPREANGEADELSRVAYMEYSQKARNRNVY